MFALPRSRNLGRIERSGLSKVANAIYSGEKLLPSLYNQIAFWFLLLSIIKAHGTTDILYTTHFICLMAVNPGYPMYSTARNRLRYWREPLANNWWPCVANLYWSHPLCSSASFVYSSKHERGRPLQGLFYSQRYIWLPNMFQYSLPWLERWTTGQWRATSYIPVLMYSNLNVFFKRQGAS